MDDTTRVLLIIGGFIFVFFLLPHIMVAVFDKAEKEADKGNGSCLGVILIVVAISVIFMFISQLKECSTSSSFNNGWEPRHTQLINSTQKNVNMKIIS